jgi:hypothetical protein
MTNPGSMASALKLGKVRFDHDVQMPCVVEEISYLEHISPDLSFPLLP